MAESQAIPLGTAIPCHWSILKGARADITATHSAARCECCSHCHTWAPVQQGSSPGHSQTAHLTYPAWLCQPVCSAQYWCREISALLLADKTSLAIEHQQIITAFSSIAGITQQQQEKGKNKIKIHMKGLSASLLSCSTDGYHHFGCLLSAMNLLTPDSPGKRQVVSLGSTKTFLMPGKLQGL